MSSPKISNAKNKTNKLLVYTVTNKSKITAAFGIRVQLLDAKGKQILPAIYSDSYFSLMQDDAKTVTVEVDPGLLKKGYRLGVKAYND
jgi:hypothetical protein